MVTFKTWQKLIFLNRENLDLPNFILSKMQFCKIPVCPCLQGSLLSSFTFCLTLVKSFWLSFDLGKLPKNSKDSKICDYLTWNYVIVMYVNTVISLLKAQALCLLNSLVWIQSYELGFYSVLTATWCWCRDNLNREFLFLLIQLVYDRSSDLRPKVKWPSARTSSAKTDIRNVH